MASVHPLRALRYTAKAGAISDLATLPYDVIPEELEAAYKSRSPHNFAHLILPRGDYAGARTRLDSWRASGLIALDTEPAIFVYEQVFLAPGSSQSLVRRGFVALGDTEEYGSTVYRHERTISGPKEDRFRLLQATQVQFDSIFMLFPDASAAVETCLAQLCLTPAAIEYSDHENTRHRLWRVSDPAWIASLQSAMVAEKLLIADGHHRYETALRMGRPRTLMTFVSMRSSGLRSFATHRLVHGLNAFDPKAFLSRLPNVGSGLELQSPPDHVRIGVALAGGNYHTDIEASPDELNVTVLQDRILTPILGLTPEKVAEGHHLTYLKQLPAALDQVRAGREQIAFLLEDLPIEGVARVSFAGQVLPQKSTYFYPKLASGLVMYELD
ncbi:MAG TPA: DUF1015 domain-containing protein [Bryobacteraceae bacterium]|nr:DUF1015 domain-containing protein [Bryobacteraceae bacterium]